MTRATAVKPYQRVEGNEIDIAEDRGWGAADDLGAYGIVYDSDRIMFLRGFTQPQRARRMFRRTLMDKFEWSDGFPRGLT
jgi:hypothetical protein